MNPAATAAPAAPSRRRRLWPWALALVLTPVLLLGVAAASYLTLNREAATLRREVMAATDTEWHTKIQLSVGRISLWFVRQGLAFVPKPEVQAAREALRAIRSVSVGVYRPAQSDPTWSRDRLFQETDRTMRARGWTRLVGVADHRENVLIYAPDDAEAGQICLAVVTGRELVVVSAAINPEALGALVAHHAGKHLPRSLAVAMR
jgi:hypothetical protein